MTLLTLIDLYKLTFYDKETEFNKERKKERKQERKKERIYLPRWGIYMRLCQSVGPLVHRSVSPWRLDTEKEKRKESKKERK